MSEALSKTLHGDFDSVFHEVTQPEKVAWTTEGQLRLFHLNIRNNKFNPEEMKTLLYRNIGEYVFSRAKIENFKVSGMRSQSERRQSESLIKTEVLMLKELVQSSEKCCSILS